MTPRARSSVITRLPEADPEAPGALPPPPPIPANADDAPVRWVFYTSGTTADPKGAQHTDLTVLVSAMAMSECLDLTESDVSGLVFPFTHIGGIGWLMATLVVGCQMVITEAFNPQDTPMLLSRSDVTLAGSGTPFHMAYLAAQRGAPDTNLFPNVRPSRAVERRSRRTPPRPPRRDRWSGDRVGLRSHRGAHRLHGHV